MQRIGNYKDLVDQLMTTKALAVATMGPKVIDLYKNKDWMEDALRQVFLVGGAEDIIGTEFGKGVLWALLLGKYAEEQEELDY